MVRDEEDGWRLVRLFERRPCSRSKQLLGFCSVRVVGCKQRCAGNSDIVWRESIWRSDCLFSRSKVAYVQAALYYRDLKQGVHGKSRLYVAGVSYRLPLFLRRCASTSLYPCSSELCHRVANEDVREKSRYGRIDVCVRFCLPFPVQRFASILSIWFCIQATCFVKGAREDVRGESECCSMNGRL